MAKRESEGEGTQKLEQVLVRLPSETYAALQLAQPFVRCRSMQDLLAAVIDEFLTTLRSEDPGFQQALVGLRESRARHDGVLSRRRTALAGDAWLIPKPSRSARLPGPNRAAHRRRGDAAPALGRLR